MTFVVRLALPPDVLALESVELAAAQRFDGGTLTGSLQKRTVPLHQLQAAQANGTLWVAVVADPATVGFLLAESLDLDLHVSEMSVIPAHGRQGIGAALMHAVKQHARDSGYERVSLTTFATVPWNGPFYAKQGFREMLNSEIGPGLAAFIEQERALGLENRVAMYYRDA